MVTIAPGAHGVIVGGGGSASRDCLLVLDASVNSPESRPRNIRCTDGDPSCDADGVANGVCQFPVGVCANSTFDPRCTIAGVESIVVDHADDNDMNDTKFDTEFLALQNAIESAIDLPSSDPDDCTGFVNIRVVIDGPLNGVCKRSKKRLKITTVSDIIAGNVYTDRDRMRFICDPDPNVCDPMVFFTGTFDRIQRQIFNKSCAKTPCHVSNWEHLAGYLVLETGTAHSELENQPAVQPDANAAGWKRVTVPVPGTGDLSTSLLFHKLNRTTLPSNFGDPMPRGGRRLDQDLIDIVQLWIEAGAPDMTWVPGTDQ